MECMANEAFRLSGVERAKIKDPESAIHLALQAKTGNDLKAILSDEGINSDLRLKRPEPIIVQPEPVPEHLPEPISEHQLEHLPESMPAPIPNRELAEVWIAQAKYDVQAMEVMYQAAENGNEELSAHVCFLAHQVAEKAVKAALANYQNLWRR